AEIGQMRRLGVVEHAEHAALVMESIVVYRAGRRLLRDHRASWRHIILRNDDAGCPAQSQPSRSQRDPLRTMWIARGWPSSGSGSPITVWYRRTRATAAVVSFGVMSTIW